MKKLKLVFAVTMAFLMLLSVACGGAAVPENITPEDDTKEPETPPVVITYTVNFSVDGEIFATKTVEQGKTLTDTVADPEKDGFTFDYWTLNGREINIYTYVVNSDITFVASFTELPPPFVPEEISSEEVNSFGAEYVNFYGRTYTNKDGLALDHSASAIEFGIIGTSLSAKIYSAKSLFICIYVDGEFCIRKELAATTKTYELLSDLSDEYHIIRIVKSNESADGNIVIEELTADKFATVPEKRGLKIEFVGDSITTGKGITGTSFDEQSYENSDATKTYAYVAADKLGADYSMVAVTGICVEKNIWTNLKMSNVYNQISAKNAKKYAFDFDPDVVVINLGTNDASYMQRENSSYADEFPNDYLALLETVHEKNPNAYIICIYGMMGQNINVTSGINTAISQMKSKYADIRIDRFMAFTENTGGCKGHPVERAQKVWGESLANYISKLNLK